MNTTRLGSYLGVQLPCGVFRVLRVIGAEQRWARVVVLEGSWKAPPTAREAYRAGLAPSPYAPMLLPGEPNRWKAAIEMNALADLPTVGYRALSSDEVRAGATSIGCFVYGALAELLEALYDAWRLTDDLPALQAELAQAQAEALREPDPEPDRLTLEALQRAPLLVGSHWPSHVRKRGRAIFTSAIKTLISLKKTGTPAQRTRVLKEVVSAFNELDASQGYIDTDACEQIIERIELMAEQVGLSNEDEALTGHRDW